MRRDLHFLRNELTIMFSTGLFGTLFQFKSFVSLKMILFSFDWKTMKFGFFPDFSFSAFLSFILRVSF
jgi:hypothetical protein